MIRQLWHWVSNDEEAEYDDLLVAVQWSSWLLGLDVNLHESEQEYLLHLGPLWIRWQRVRYR